MRAKVAFLARVKNEDGTYPFRKVEIARGRPVPIRFATAYYLRFTENGARKTQAVGANLDAAFIAYQNRELNLTRAGMGLAPVVPFQDTKETNQTHISDAVAKYLADLESSVRTGQKTNTTLAAYKRAVEVFRDHSGVEMMEEITGEVLRKYKVWLFENTEKRIRGKKSNTVANIFRFLSAFLSKNGIQLAKSKNTRPGDRGLMDWSDVPRATRKEYVNKYSEDEINAMLSVANDDEADLIQTFLRTGCRDKEVVFLHWSDLDFKREQIIISEKPKYQWRPKDRESRTIPLEDGVLLERLKARALRQQPPSELVFPNRNGDPDTQLIRRLHKIVKKAERSGLRFEGEMTMHRFRRTYASMMISHSDLQTVSELLGHSDLQTTARYLAPDQTKARIGTRTAFKNIA